MLQLCVWMIWLGLYQYYIEQICELEKGYIKRIAVWGLTLGPLLAVGILKVIGLLPRDAAGTCLVTGSWLLITLVLFLYVLFYDEKPFRQQWWKVLASGTVLTLCALGGSPALAVLLNGVVFIFFLMMLAGERGYLRLGSSLVNLGIYGLLSIYVWYKTMLQEPLREPCSRVLQAEINQAGTVGNLISWLYSRMAGEMEGTLLLAGVLILELLLFLALEGTLFSWHRGFEAETERFQRDILSHQYEEVKEIYLNMRGWRHDYHNHLQAMKAQIAAGQLEEMKQYLSDLEQNLEKVDTYVKSGNLMADAVLNSKLSLAEQKGIRVNCKAILPETLTIEDVDLCVLLGNLLDNALEACEKIPEQQRFLRIYMVVNKSQLYISIQNSAKEELDFNERNYISTKRGNHGLGMKRARALTDKYEGYLTLANEPGIFAAEVTLPL